MQVDLIKVNKILSDLDGIRGSYGRTNDFKLISRDVIKELNSYGEQDEEGQSFEVYSYEDIHFRLEIRTDSYGDNERVVGVQFVEPKPREITVYETYE